MKKEIIYSSGNYLRDEFKIEGYLLENKVKDQNQRHVLSEQCVEMNISSYIFVLS